ncbi:MAG: hypothetical protein V9G98_02455 [Candidatus Competibacter sp.]
MGEVDHADDAVHHGVADGDQGIDATEGQTIDDLLEEFENRETGHDRRAEVVKGEARVRRYEKRRAGFLVLALGGRQFI